jgi:hypothetical protein
MKTIVARQPAPVKFERIDMQQREKLAKNGPDVSRYRDQRAKWEGPATPPPPLPSAGAHNQPVPELPPNRRPVTPPAEAHGPPMVAPRAVPPTRPERVPIPASPIQAKPDRAAGTTHKAPQAPSGERNRQAEQSKGDKKNSKDKKDKNDQ